MDSLSHILLNNLIYKDVPMESRVWAIVLGAIPDLFGFSSMFNTEDLKRALFFKKMPQSMIPKKAILTYRLSHSLVLWMIIFLFLYFLNYKWAAMIWCGWALHILTDVFTHSSRSALAPRIFWPLSDWCFAGFNWSQKKFLIFSYSLFAILYFIFYF
ncbi:MAG: hypothetical protein PHR00_01180 [Patescibacteria group bacterium]|nr:hypothetical protein [Patescibacteria group bacterium]